MSSSIAIPTRSYGESSKAAAASPSPSSSYSNSPKTPQQQQKSTPASASPTTKYGLDRRPSLLSKLSKFCYRLGQSNVACRNCWHHRWSLDDMINTIMLRNKCRGANICTGSSFSKQEHTVINIGDPEGVPRLVRTFLTCKTHKNRYLLTHFFADYLCTILTRL